MNSPGLEGSRGRKQGHLGEELVLAAKADPLRGGGRVEVEVRADPGVLPGAPHGVLDGVEDAGGEEEGRLPHRLARVHGPGVGDATEEAHVELGGDVIETGNLICTRAY